MQWDNLFDWLLYISCNKGLIKNNINNDGNKKAACLIENVNSLQKNLDVIMIIS